MKKNIISLVFILVMTNLLGQSNKANLSQTPADYEKLNLTSGNTPQIWEDGFRTNGEKGTYEWWYFDAHLDDGTTIVFSFNTKPFTEIHRGLKPMVLVNIDKPDGTAIEIIDYSDPKEFFASKEKCDVRIGKHFFKGDLENYQIHFENAELKVDFNLHRTTQSWRPKTGHINFGDKGDHFSWLVPVPKGETDVTITYKGNTTHSKGMGYHDHNFGNKIPGALMNHWYWSRAEFGPFTIIAAEIISNKKFNNESIIVFCVAKDGQIIADEGEKVTLFRTYDKMHPIGEKPINDKLIFQYDSPEDSTKIEYVLHKKKMLVESKILDKVIQNKVKRSIAKALTGFNGAYYRITGDTKLNVYKNGSLVETYFSNKAIWELMYLGSPLE